MFSTSLRHRSSFRDLISVLSSSSGLHLRESTLYDHDVAVPLPLTSPQIITRSQHFLPNRDSQHTKDIHMLKLLLLSPMDTTEDCMPTTLSRIRRLKNLSRGRNNGSKFAANDDNGNGSDSADDSYTVDVIIMFLLTEPPQTSTPTASTSTATPDSSTALAPRSGNHNVNVLTTIATTSSSPTSLSTAGNQPHNHGHNILSGHQAYARLTTALFNASIPSSPFSDLFSLPILPFPSPASFESTFRAYARNFNAGSTDAGIVSVARKQRACEQVSTSIWYGDKSRPVSLPRAEPQPGLLSISTSTPTSTSGRRRPDARGRLCTQQQERQLQLLALCSTAAPLSEETTLAVARVFSSFRELADAAVSVSVGEGRDRAEAAEKLNRLRRMLESSGVGSTAAADTGGEAVARMVEFWQEEWTVD